MVLKKQTVWLITMLSLLIVLSVYYMTSPTDDQFAIVENGDDENRDDQENDDESGNDNMMNGFDDMDVSGISSANEMFAAIRLERQDQLSEMKEQLNAIVASSNATTEEKHNALEQISDLQTTAQKESILERKITQEKGFHDVLVRKDENFIEITVIADELSKSDANHLMQMARDEFGVMDVRVKLQSDDF